MPGAKRTPKPKTSVAKQTRRATVKSEPKAVADKAKRPRKSVPLATDPRRPRRIRPRYYKNFRLTKRIRHHVKLPSVWKIAKKSRLLLYQNWKLIGGIVLIYEVLNIVLVRGLNGGADVRLLRQEFDLFFHGFLGNLAAGFSIFAILLSSTTSAVSTGGSANATTYQVILVLVVSLVLIWTYRQLLAGNKVTIRDAFYKSMAPLIPLMLVLVVICLQLLPVIAGGWAYAIVLQNHIAVTAPEKFLWGLLFAMLVLLSFYMICSSFFAVYVVTLADMTPLKALRSARELVRYRRWTVMRKVVFLPFFLLIIGSLIMLPFILFLAIAAQWIFFGLTMIGLAFSHAYMYSLYRELLHEKNPS